MIGSECWVFVLVLDLVFDGSTGYLNCWSEGSCGSLVFCGLWLFLICLDWNSKHVDGWRLDKSRIIKSRGKDEDRIIVIVGAIL